MPVPTDEQLAEMMAQEGLSDQLFPKYYAMGPKEFSSGGASSAAAGSTAVLTKQLTNFGQILYGVRIQNFYSLPTNPTDFQVQLFESLKRWVDDEQIVGVNLSQQDVTAQEVPQAQFQGRADTVWHPFPVPYPMAGGNNINITITRVTSYPEIVAGTPLVVTTRGTLVAAEFKGVLPSEPTRRRLARPI